MASVQPSHFKNGMCIKYNDKLCTIVEFQHVKPGKGGAFIRTKLKDVETGRVVDYTFRPGDKFDEVRLETKEVDYSWTDGNTYYFMDNETYEQLDVPAALLGSNAQWFKEGDTCLAQYADGELINVEPPMFVEMEVTDTEPGFKGNTVQSGTKPATLETGVEVKVPLFIDVGDKVKVDSRDGRFVERL
ncbi:MAG: elongation factor P [Coriobacteriaceae bacterium]|nr:elongation factor P [Coriobacteriaceae bacterium]